jgi:hypothetical protein
MTYHMLCNCSFGSFWHTAHPCFIVACYRIAQANDIVSLYSSTPIYYLRVVTKQEIGSQSEFYFCVKKIDRFHCNHDSKTRDCDLGG